MRKGSAYSIYLFYSLAAALFFTIFATASSVYRVTAAHLNPIQLVLVGTTLEAAVFLFEVPTGVVADVYSRRLSVIIGVAMIGCGLIVEGLFPIFLPILAAQVIWGVGYTFTSGALDAWITDEIGEAAAGAAFLRAAQLGQVGGVLGTLAGIGLGSVWINLPFLTAGVLFVLLALVLAVIMPENGFTPLPPEERSSWTSIQRTFTGGLGAVRRRPALQTILWIGLVYGLYSEAFDRLWVAHALDTFILPLRLSVPPVAIIGSIDLIAMLLTIAATQVVSKRVNTARPISIASSMLLTSAALVAGLLVYALTRNIWAALASYLLIMVLRRINDPLYTAWVNHRLDSNVRATVLSMSGQVDAIGQVVGGPALGAVGTAFGVRAALFASGLVLSPVLALFARARREEINAALVEPELDNSR